ncbi:MAG: flagellar biosynthetic protein FliO [Clostridium sp.]|uniref:flagellar biosynthetic protein FliO n=1 Tax=Clostridium sp. TaxID=1506 RepID=UPI003F2DB4D6
MEVTIMFLKLIVSLIIVLGLMGITFKLANSSVKKINKDKYIKVIEKTQIGKDTSLMVVKVGEEGFLMSVSSGKTEKLKELKKEEIEKLEKEKKENEEKIDGYYFLVVDKFKNGINALKESKKAKEKENG